MKQLLRRFGVPFTMLIFCALLCVYIYRLPKAVREPLPVLMYHHLVEDGQDCNDMTVTPSKLRSDLETILALGYTPVLPRELAAGGPLPEKPILITFDDGYRATISSSTPFCRNTTSRPAFPSSSSCRTSRRTISASGRSFRR